MIVGEAMARTVGVTARAANALSKAGVNLEIINQGVFRNQRHVRRTRRILQLCGQGTLQGIFPALKLIKCFSSCPAPNQTWIAAGRIKSAGCF